MARSLADIAGMDPGIIDPGWNGDWHMDWMVIWWLLGVALITVIVWVLVRPARGSGSASDLPEGILQRRYARGEIDQQTYVRMLGELRERENENHA